MSAWFIPIVVTLGGFLASKIAPEGDWLPKGPPAIESSHLIRIWAGQTSQTGNADAISLAGGLPGVALFDELGNLINDMWYEDWNVPEGNFRDIQIPGLENNNARAAYIRLDAHQDDAICIAGISVTYPDGGKVAMYGDVMTQVCGWKGYPSITDFPLPGRGSTGYRPNCFWLDGDNSYNEGYPKSVHLHIPDFEATNETILAYSADKDLMCKSQARLGKSTEIAYSIPIFDPPLTYDPDGWDGFGNMVGTPTYLDPDYVLDDRASFGQSDATEKEPNYPSSCCFKRGSTQARAQRSGRETFHSEKRRRSARKARQESTGSSVTTSTADVDEFNSKIVVSSSSELSFSAEYLCSRGYISGPHYANTYEGKFCKTDDHSLWDLCRGNVASNCFDLDSMQLWGGTDLVVDKGVDGAINPLLSLSTRIDMGS